MRRRKFDWKGETLKLDPGCTLSGGRKWLGGRPYDLYTVKDSAGREIGWTEGNEQGPHNAWVRAYSQLSSDRRKANG